MAATVRSESFRSAVIDAKDMTITEYIDDGVKTYSIQELLNRWDGIPGVTLSIRRSVPLPPDGRDE